MNDEGLIKNQIRTNIAQSGSEKFSGSAEPGVQTLRKQVLYQLHDPAREWPLGSPGW